MADVALRIQKLAIHRFRGIRQQEDAIILTPEQLSPGINLVYGPNASGKTTLAHAILAVLWPELEGRKNPLIDATLVAGDHSIERELAPGRGNPTTDEDRWLDGVMPPVEHADRYYFALHELLRADDAMLATIIQRELNGGLDLNDARAALGFSDAVPNTNTAIYRQWQEAQTKRRQVQARQADLVRRENELESVLEEENAATSAARRAEALARRKDYLEARLELAESEARLATFDSLCERLQGDELELWHDLARQREAVEQELADVSQQLAAAAEKQVQARLGQDGLPEGLFAELADRIRKLDEAEQSAAGLRERLSESQSVMDGIRVTLGSDAPEALAGDSRSEWVAESRELMRQFESIAGRVAAAAELDDWLAPDADDQVDPATVERGLYLLTRWLRADALAARVSTVRVEHVVVLIVCVILLLLLGLLVSPWWCLGLLMPAVIVLQAVRHGVVDGSPRAIAAEFEALALSPPASWEADRVLMRLDQLAAQLASGRLTGLRQQLRQVKARERQKLEAELAGLDERRRELAEKAGLSPATGEQHLYLVVEALSRLDQAVADVNRHAGALAAANRRIGESLACFNQSVSPYTDSVADDAAAAHGIRQELQARERQFADAVTVGRTAKENQERITRQLHSLEERQTALKRRLVPDAAETDTESMIERLSRCVEQLPDYRNVKAAVQNLSFQCERSVTGEGDAERDTGGDQLQELLGECEAELAASLEEAAKGEPLQRLRAEIETLVAEARRHHDLEEAMAAEANARDALGGLLEETDRSVAGVLLLEDLLRSTQTQASNVLARARQRFGQVSQYRYELEVTGGDPARFRARDTVRDRVLELEELSSGTRVQLLLAVRMAFIEEQEGGSVRLPLLLDEILANSDEWRAEAVMNAVVSVAQEGRQVFCFSAQEDELAKWQAALAARPELPCTIVTLPCGPEKLGDVRLEAAMVPTVSLAPPADGLTHRAYGELLDLPACDPFAPVDRLHLWYLVEDPDVLRRLLDSGYTHWGQLRRLLARGGDAFFSVIGIAPERDLGAQLQAIAKVVHEAFRLYRVGRSRPLAQADLVDSPLGRSVYLSAIIDCAAQHRWEAEAFLQALEDREVKGVGPVQTGKVRDDLLETGLLDEREPLSLEAIRIEVDAAASGFAEARMVDLKQVRSLVATALATAAVPVSEVRPHGTA